MNNVINIILREEVNSFIINETNRIQRLTDDDYPYPQVDLDMKDFAKMRDVDDAFNQKRREKMKAKGLPTKNFKPIDTQDTKFHSPQRGIPKAEIDDYQEELTQNVKNRAIEKTGSDFVNTDNMDLSPNVKEMLSKSGLELEVKGDVFVYGNHKLPADTMIVNLTSAFNCPSLNCPLRQGVCYAGKGEKQYKHSELRNLRNQYTFEYLTVKEILQLLDMYIKAAPAKIHNIRISENGDFKSQEVVDFCDKLAGHVYAKYGIRTTCYTHQRFDFTNCNNMIVNSSLPREAIKGADRNYLVMLDDRVKDKKGKEKKVGNKEFDSLIGDGKIHTRINKRGEEEYYFKCSCDCKLCNFCYNTKEENGEPTDARVNVYVREH